MKKTKIFLALSIGLFALPLFSSASFDYTPMEPIPGFATSGDFQSYISAVYKFGIWTVGIAAMLMIMIGGYMYMMSAGNNTSMQKAKGVITDAIVGLILALTSYLILYEINPNLVNINLGSIGGGSGSVSTGNKTCNNNNCGQVASACQANSIGIEPAVLQSLFIAGEGCNKAASGTGPCGYSQVNATNRKAICGMTGTAAQTCAEIQGNLQEDVDCGAKVVQDQRRSSKCQGGIINTASCYATGPGANFACGNPNDTNYCNRVANYYSTCSK